jgi:hypothetical protein
MEISPNVQVIVLGVSEDDESEIVARAEAGVVGYHLRTESLEAHPADPCSSGRRATFLGRS